MSEQMVSAYDQTGEFIWFYEKCSKSWSPTLLMDGPLYYQDGQWVLMSGALEILENPEGKVVDDQIALAWLIRNGYELPEEISACASKHRI